MYTVPKSIFEKKTHIAAVQKKITNQHNIVIIIKWPEYSFYHIQQLIFSMYKNK